MKKISLLTALFFTTLIYAQNHYCGQDLYQQKIYEENPSLRPENNLAYQELEEFTKNFTPNNSNLQNKNIEDLIIGTDYIIPVVVHVIHDFGSENVSDAVIERAIEMLNRFFGGNSAYDNNTDPSFLAIRGGFNSPRLKFVLANYDPDGNPTTGIDRQVSSFFTTRGNNDGMRQTYNWPRENYFNIYVVRQAIENSGTSAFATFPASVNDSALAFRDGVVMSAWSFGEHTEMWQTWYHNLAHEVGHWINLQHIWANAGNNGDSVYCNQDDSVSDTPNTTGNSLADLDDFPGIGSVFNCGSVDNYTNMMDYTAAVYSMFTQGQKTRMEASLNSSIADRNNLWSTNNIFQTLYDCNSFFDSDSDGIPNDCDECPNDINNDSDGDGICDSLDQCNGYPDVNLDGNPSQMDACDTLWPIIDFGNQTISSYDASEDKGVYDIYTNGSELYVSVNGWKAIPINYTVTPNTIIEFDFKSTIEGELHYIGIDDDLLLEPLQGFALYGTQTTGLPVNTDLSFKNYSTVTDFYNYKHYSIPIGTFYTGTAPYLVFAADNDTVDNVWTTGTTYPGGGSYNEATSFFRNVKIYESSVLSTETFDNIESLVSVYPNPVDSMLSIKVSDNVLLSQLTIHDISGKLVKTINLKDRNSNQINLQELSTGVYFAKVESNRGTTTKKIIKL